MQHQSGILETDKTAAKARSFAWTYRSLVATSLLAVACSGNSDGGTAGAGGIMSSGGTGGGGAATSAVGTPIGGSATGIGGIASFGGASLVDSTSVGGTPAVGGTSATGGTSTTGGSSAKGGATSAGGTTATGGSSAKGGATNAGGTTATGGSSAKGGATSAGGTTATSGTTSVNTCIASPVLAVTKLSTTAIASMGTPFDTSSSDRSGPYDWATRYGKTPELIARVYSGGLDILWQDYAVANRAFLVRVEPSGGGYAITSAWQLSTLGLVMGFDRDTSGNFVVASGVKEDRQKDATTPAAGEHRANIVRIVQFDTAGCVLREIDVDKAREAKSATSEPLISPMNASTGRLEVNGTEIALIHGINTDYDTAVSSRHQKAITTHLSLSSGAVTRTNSMWMSHSFDQRLFHDGTGFVELHVGDAYDRTISLGRYTASAGVGNRTLFSPKGDSGDNVTHTRLGGIAPISTGTYGYLVAFSTERETAYTASTVSGHLDLAVARVVRSIGTTATTYVDTTSSNVSTQTVTSAGKSVTNYVQWLTSYAANVHAERPKLVGLPNDQFLILWERWTGTTAANDAYTGTWATVIDATGATVAEPAQISSEPLSRGDDPVALDGKGVYVTADGPTRQLLLNFVSPTLGHNTVTLP